MPRLSDSMTEGTLLAWCKNDGERVEVGEEIAEIETDKATMSFEAEAAGTLRHVATEGQTLPVGAVIARVGDGDPRDSPAPPAQPEPRPSSVTPSSPARQATTAASASPLARRIAARHGVDLDALRGTGPRGRILKADVRAVLDAGDGPARTAAASAGGGDHASDRSVTTAKGGVEVVELSRLQRTVALRMSESKATVPDFWIAAEVDMTGVVELREELRDIVNPAPSVNDFLIKAAALALRRHPRANSSFRQERFELHERINVGFAVAAADALLVPVLRDVDRLPISELASETRRLASSVREGTIAPADLGGATFTISNLGMMGVSAFAGIVDPPCAAILCVGAVERRAIVRDGEIVAAPTATLTLVSDHRILYGADAAAFLAEVRTLLEHPLSTVV